MSNYDPIERKSGSLLAVRVLLTCCMMEFFGPWLRDYSSSHVFHPEWVGHARLHMMWLLGFMLFSGIANLYLIWFTRPLRLIHLYVAAAWTGANLLGFWLAIVMVPVYDGLITVPDTHYHIFGIDENVFGFSILSTLYLIAIGILRLRVVPQLRTQDAQA